MAVNGWERIAHISIHHPSFFTWKDLGGRELEKGVF